MTIPHTRKVLVMMKLHIDDLYQTWHPNQNDHKTLISMSHINRAQANIRRHSMAIANILSHYVGSAKATFMLHNQKSPISTKSVFITQYKTIFLPRWQFHTLETYWSWWSFIFMIYTKHETQPKMTRNPVFEAINQRKESIRRNYGHRECLSHYIVYTTATHLAQYSKVPSEITSQGIYW